MKQNIGNKVVRQVEHIRGMSEGAFPIKYLGCPISHTKKNKEDSIDFLDKVRGKLKAWKGKMLSYGGKEVVLTSVL